MDSEELYDLADVYDLAFDFRDVPAECDVLVELCRREAGREPSSFLGPGLHVLEMAGRGLRAEGLDLAPSMRELALRRAAERGLRIDYHVGDMVDFELEGRFDLAALLMNSAVYLHDNDALLRHLACVARHLEPGGLYVLEMSHPRDVLTQSPGTESIWERVRGDRRVSVRWGEPDDPFDPVTQIGDRTISYEWTFGERSGRHTALSRERRFTGNELLALVQASPCFELVARFGALDLEIPLDDRPQASRMVTVLRRSAQPGDPVTPGP
jgi:SAM-dependent methyltransferase